MEARKRHIKTVLEASGSLEEAAAVLDIDLRELYGLMVELRIEAAKIAQKSDNQWR